MLLGFMDGNMDRLVKRLEGLADVVVVVRPKLVDGEPLGTMEGATLNVELVSTESCNVVLLELLVLLHSSGNNMQRAMVLLVSEVTLSLLFVGVCCVNTASSTLVTLFSDSVVLIATDSCLSPVDGGCGADVVVVVVLGGGHASGSNQHNRLLPEGAGDGNDVSLSFSSRSLHGLNLLRFPWESPLVATIWLVVVVVVVCVSVVDGCPNKSLQTTRVIMSRELIKNNLTKLTHTVNESVMENSHHVVARVVSTPLR